MPAWPGLEVTGVPRTLVLLPHHLATDTLAIPVLRFSDQGWSVDLLEAALRHIDAAADNPVGALLEAPITAGAEVS